MTVPMPPAPPLPPREGDFDRVRRAARLRRLRVPAAGLASVLAVVLAVSALTSTPQRDDSLEITSTPSATASMDDGSSSPVPTPSASVSPSPSVTETDGETRTAAPDPAPSRAPSPSVRMDPPAAFHVRCGADGKPVETAGPAITGQVRNEAGQPVAGLVLTGLVCNGTTAHSGGAAGRTDANGRFSVPCLDHWLVVGPFEWYTGKRFTAAPVGYEWLGEGMFRTVPCGSEHDIVLPPAGTVHVTFQDSDGNSIAGAQLGLFTEHDEATNFTSLTTDAEGKASFTGLNPGRYFVYTHPERYHWFDIGKGATVQTTYVATRNTTTPDPSPSASATTATTPAARYSLLSHPMPVSGG